MNLTIALASLDVVAREQLSHFLRIMAAEAKDLMHHALLPVSEDMLMLRMKICEDAATLLDMEC